MSDKALTMDDYITGFPANIQERMQVIRRTVHETVPGLTEGISYAIPVFKLGGKNLVFFAAYKHHIGFYPVPSDDPFISEELKQYKTGKGSVQFPLDRELPLELVKRITRYYADRRK